MDRRSASRAVCASTVALVLLGVAGALLTGCTTSQARSADPSGFLGDYSQLREGSGDEALLTYVDKAADWKRYTKIRFDPVTAFATSQLADVPHEQVQEFVDYVDAAVREALKDDYAFVDHDGPDVLHLRIAITEAEGAFVPLNAFSTLMPIGRVLAEAKQLATGTGAFTGSAGVELDLRDSASDARLFAAVDRRVGRKAVKGMFSKWSDVTEAYDAWAGILRDRLASLRSGSR